MARRAFVVGVNTYGLRYAAQDAGRLQGALREYGYEVRQPESDKHDILSRFDTLIDTTMRTDTVIVYFSGHAILERGSLQFLVGEDTKKVSNRLNLTDLIANLSYCDAENKLLILDCCHANAGIKEWHVEGSDRYRILTASEYLQRTTETDQLEASFFTYQLVDLLKDPPVAMLDTERQILLNNLYQALLERIHSYNATRKGQQLPLPNLLGNQKHNFVIGKHAALDEHASERYAKTKAERRYRELTLKACDIIDLANLPEDKRVLTGKLQLRRLYVPLRIVVEIEKKDEESVDAALSRLERKRHTYKKIDLDRRYPLEKQLGQQLHWEIDLAQRYPVGERLDRARRLVVLGDPGAGKSTLLRWMTTAYLLRLDGHPDWHNLPDVETLPNENWLPVLIRCRDLDGTALEGTLEDILARTFRKSEMSPLNAAAFEQVVYEKLHGGEVLLLIDGLDEITQATARAHFCRQIERIAKAYESVPIVVTSRIVGYREMGYRLQSGFEHGTVADLSKDDKDLFARQWCELTEPVERQVKATNELIEGIHSSDRIEQLTSNPMLLTTMALVKRRVGKLPTHRAELYFEAVRVLLVWRTDVDEILDYREAEPQLRYIAYEMSDRGTQTLREDELLNLLRQMRVEYPNLHDIHKRTPREFLQTVERRTGILIQAGHTLYEGQSEPVYEFRHLTFQDYMAGMALIKKQFSGFDGKRKLAYYVAPLAGRIDENAGRAVVTESWREPLRICVYSCGTDVADEVLLAILHPLPSEDPMQTKRPRAVLAALCLADEPNVSDLTAEIVLSEFANVVEEGDGTGIVTTLADRTAVELATSRWITLLRDSLISAFLRHDNNRQRLLGLAGLWAMAANRRREAAKDSDAEWIKRQLSLLSARQPGERVAAALALMMYCFRENVDVDAYIHVSADSLIAMIPESEPLGISATAALMWLSSDALEEQRWSPTSIQRKRLYDGVIRTTSSSVLKGFASSIFGNLKMNEAADLMVTWLNDVDADALYQIAVNLEKIEGGGEAVVPLVARLEDEDEDVRHAAANALGRIGSEEAVAPLVARLEDEDEDVRRAAANALGRIGSEEAVGPLLVRLEETEALVRGAAASALGSIGSEEAIAPLVGRLEDADEGVRRAAANALGRIGSEEAIAPLVARLEDPSARVRGTIFAALVKLDVRFDEADLVLISRDLDGIEPFIDPESAILPSHLKDAAEELELTLEEVMDRATVLAASFELPLM